MLQQIIESQTAEVQRDATERLRDMTAEQELRDLAVANADASNRAAAAAQGLQNDFQQVLDKLEQGTVTPEALQLVRDSVAKTGQLADFLTAMDSAYPVPEPTPTPAPDDTTEVPPVEEAPGQEPIPTDGGGDGSGAGGTGDGGADTGAGDTGTGTPTP